MIEGIHIEMPHTKLAELLTSRAAFHEKKAAMQREAAIKVKQTMDAAADDDIDNAAERAYSGETMVGGKQFLVSRAATHERQAQFFRLLAENLIAETYRLSLRDCETLELIGR